MNSLHTSGIIHRDIKPDNIIIDTIRDANGPGIKLTGFTYSKIFNENNNETMKLTLGTRYFMAPEMISNPGHIEHDVKVDTWAVGVVAFFILS